MLNCVPRVRAATSKYILNRASEFNDNAWNNLLATPIYVHWPTLCNVLKDSTIESNKTARRILAAWEDDKLIPIPHGEDADELPSIVRLDERFPDNVVVLCHTFGEYVNLRRNFGREDIGGFTLNDV
jgi:hypothetical protein